MLVALALALASCRDGGSPLREATTVTTAPAATVATLPPLSGSTSTTPASLWLAVACERFYGLIAETATLGDDESASAFGALARQTAEIPSLAAAIQRVADQFAAHAASVLTGDVTALCPPSRYLPNP